MLVTVVGLAFIAIFIAYGWFESKQNEKALERLRVRINVNGIRGKSTVTRLITAILSEAGYDVIGKTTGTAARFIHADGEEEPIARKPEGANIKEQLACIKKAAGLGANALVCECMAVKPEYQVIVQEQMLKANICVIVNILEDHLDVMGPTLLQIAEAFSKTIPYNGYCVTVSSPYLYVLERVCCERGSKLVVVNEDVIPEEYMERFSYEIFPANLALAFGVAHILGIDPVVAAQGALKANPDPGAARAYKARDNDMVFVNGFAANEPTSTWAIWKRMEKRGLIGQGTIILFNGRPDRVDRTQQFVRDFFPYLPNGSILVCMGGGLSCITKAYNAGEFPGVEEYVAFEGRHVASKVLEYLAASRNHGKCIYGVGNIHGEGGFILEAMDFGFRQVIERERNAISRFRGRTSLGSAQGDESGQIVATTNQHKGTGKSAIAQIGGAAGKIGR